jgi:hypothetical protein
MKILKAVLGLVGADRPTDMAKLICKFSLRTLQEHHSGWHVRKETRRNGASP